MTARGLLARTSVLCAVAALGACAGSHNAARVVPVAAPVQNVGLTLPEIAPASTALARVTNALSVSVRKIQHTPQPTAGLLASTGVQPRTVLISSRLQCVPFARERSGVAIRGNANTWWNQAAGSFVRVKRPAVGAVMVMNTRRGHVGVVTKIVDNRTVIIDHSNWLSNGQIYLDQPVMDVSANNDWSKVVVWHPTLGKFGKRALGVPGFIVDAPARGNNSVYASLADVPASLAANVQYAEAIVAPKKAAPVKTKTAPVVAPAAPVLVASATVEAAPVATRAYRGPVTVPVAKPTAVAALAAPASVQVAATAATPAQEAAAAPMALAEVKPVYVDTITPRAKPGSVSAPMAMAAAKPVYVDTIVPGAKPTNLGATEVAVLRKGEAQAASSTADSTFVPSGKPESVATFR